MTREKSGPELFLTLIITMFLLAGSCRSEKTLTFDADKWVGKWVTMWNSYDLLQVDKLFLTDARLTYFSSEKEGAIIGIEAVREHHRGFGFVEGGNKKDTRLWLEDIRTRDFDTSVVVTAIWLFKRESGEVQRGPVTFVYLPGENDYRLIHLHFSNYLETE